MPSDIGQKNQVLPSITGKPMLDTSLRIAFTSLSAAITGIIINWLSSHNIADPRYPEIISTLVFFVLTGAATVLWSLLQTKKNQEAVAAHVIDAFTTGVIPQIIQDIAEKSAVIPNEKIATAVANASTMISNQPTEGK